MVPQKTNSWLDTIISTLSDLYQSPFKKRILGWAFNFQIKVNIDELV